MIWYDLWFKWVYFKVKKHAVHCALPHCLSWLAAKVRTAYGDNGGGISEESSALCQRWFPDFTKKNIQQIWRIYAINHVINNETSSLRNNTKTRPAGSFHLRSVTTEVATTFPASHGALRAGSTCQQSSETFLRPCGFFGHVTKMQTTKSLLKARA